ncbi:MAG: ABC transporter ATP-binding protein [Chitinivibrionales bacterium]
MPVLSIQNLSTSFNMHSGIVRAVSDVSFNVDQGEITGIVGESGCGKTALCLSLLRLIPQPPGKIEAAGAFFKDTNLVACSLEEIRRIRGNRISMIFQDPLSSLNPYMKVFDQLIEPLQVHNGLSKKQCLPLARAALDEVGLGDPANMLSAYPHEFSGGMRQRIMIAMALITQPDVLIADEPTTALDVTVQAQILTLIRSLLRTHGMSVIFITHNLGIVAHLCNRVLVMYAGRIMEEAPVRDLFYHTQHPYTRALIQSLPSVRATGEKLKAIAGLPPDLSRPILGCPFADRCEFVKDYCRNTPIELKKVEKSHASACTRIINREITL